jgi:hypothetical protein
MVAKIKKNAAVQHRRGLFMQTGFHSKKRGIFLY